MRSLEPLNAQWIQTAGPINYVRVFGVSGTNLFAGVTTPMGYYVGIFLSTDYGGSWTAINSGLTNNALSAVYTFAISGANVFAGTYGGVYLSTNNGTSWTTLNNGLPKNSYDTTVCLVDGLVFSGSNLFAAASQGVYISTNFGSSWSATSSGPGASGNPVYCLASSDSSLFAGTGGSGVFRSTDNGTTWTQVNTGLTHPLVWSLALSGKNLFAASWGGGVFLSTNDGTSWTAVNNGLTVNISSRIYAFAFADSNLFAGTSDGVFLSTNNGTNWTSVNSGLGSSTIESLAILGANLFAGTPNGVWRRPLTQMTSIEEAPTILPMHFALMQNYPNPFNASTTISFSLPSKSFVSLKVFDALGREVSNIVADDFSAGSHSWNWNPQGLSSGVYFCRLRAGSFVAIRKLVFLR